MSILTQNLEDLKPTQNLDFLAPDGMHTAKCIAIADLGLLENKYQKNKDGSAKMQHKAEIVWAIDKKMENGELLIIKKMFTLSLSDQANLKEMLDDTKIEIKSLQDLLGTTCAIVTQREKKDEKSRTYANIKTFMASQSFTGEGVLRLPKWYGVTKDQDADSQYIEVLTDEGVLIDTDKSQEDLPY